jgi:hypothetical protein
MALATEPQVRIERGETRRRADVAPVAAVALAGQPASGEGAVEQRLQREIPENVSFAGPAVARPATSRP